MHQIGYGKFLEIVKKHRDELFKAAKTHVKEHVSSHASKLRDHSLRAIQDKLGDSEASKVAQSAIEGIHSSFQAGLSGSGAEFNGIGAPKALPYVVMVTAPSAEEAQEAAAMGIPDEAISGGAFAPFSWLKKSAASAVDKAATLGSQAVQAVKTEAGNMLETTIKPLFAKYKPAIESAIDKGANKLMDAGFNEIEGALAAEVPEIIGPMKALGIDKKLKSWVESRVDGLINQGIEQLMGSGWGSGAMLPGSGAMLPGSGAMLPGSGSGIYNVTDHMQHPALRNSFHPSMLRRAK